MVDWGAGRYERTADELQPVAETLIGIANIQPGERVLDVACGTGNGALLAAQAGASAMGIDLAPRLVEVARSRAHASGGRGAEHCEGKRRWFPFAFGYMSSLRSDRVKTGASRP
jgi:ubiquinone/menaquinone biosynthesis C-methylase UbiE